MGQTEWLGALAGAAIRTQPAWVQAWFYESMLTNRGMRREAERLAEARRLAKNGDGRRIRQAAGLSQPEVARAIGTTHVTIGRWERAERVPRHEAAVRWVELLLALDKGGD